MIMFGRTALQVAIFTLCTAPEFAYDLINAASGARITARFAKLLCILHLSMIKLPLSTSFKLPNIYWWKKRLFNFWERAGLGYVHLYVQQTATGGHTGVMLKGYPLPPLRSALLLRASNNTTLPIRRRRRPRVPTVNEMRSPILHRQLEWFALEE